MKDVLVTGGCGYIGSVVVHEVANDKHVESVRVLDNLTSGRWVPPTRLGDVDVKFVRGDIRNHGDLGNALRGVDTVFHLAGIVGEKACDKDPSQTRDVNVRSVPLIVEASRRAGVSHLIFASTCSVYGEQESDAIADENSRVNPISLYGRTKIEAEKTLRDAHNENGLDVTVLRLSTIYGYSPSIRFDLFLNLFVRQALQHKTIGVYGGEKWRPVLYTLDAARAFVLAAERRSKSDGMRILNVGSDIENYQIVQIARLVAELLNGAIEIRGQFDSDRRSYRVSFKRIKEELGFEPQFTLRGGIEHLAKSLQDEARQTVKIPLG